MTLANRLPREVVLEALSQTMQQNINRNAMYTCVIRKLSPPKLCYHTESGSIPETAHSTVCTLCAEGFPESSLRDIPCERCRCPRVCFNCLQRFPRNLCPFCRFQLPLRIYLFGSRVDEPPTPSAVATPHNHNTNHNQWQSANAPPLVSVNRVFNG